MKVLVSAITEIHCSIVIEISTKNSKIRLGSVLVNSAVCHNRWKTLENGLRSHRKTSRINYTPRAKRAKISRVYVLAHAPNVDFCTICHHALKTSDEMR